MIEQEPGHPAPRPTKLRPLPSRIPPGAHVLSIADLKAIARFAGHGDDPIMGEELVPHVIHHSMFGADSGRIIPETTLAEPELGDGDPIAGRKVLIKFLSNIRRQRSRNRTVHEPVNLQELVKRIPLHRLKRMIGGTHNITMLQITPEDE